MKWKATTTGTIYFALKIGSNKTTFSYSFDNFTLKDLTAIETPIGQIPADEGPFSREGRIYNMSGQAVMDKQKKPGIYLVNNDKRTKKILINR